tara:strand:- start:882 stop:1094 length:213 start_codon:yes stop_codon:yes gene_type:complete
MSTALRYSLAWNYCFSHASKFHQRQVIDEPQGEWADRLAKEVALLAESDKEIPVVQSNYKVDEPVLSGTK